MFVDGKVTESDLHAAIDAHLQVCDIAHRDAHDYHHPDPRKTPISVSSVNPDLEPDHYESESVIGNLGSYIGEYIGAYGERLFDRGLSELIFRASVWATGTQLVRFSNGANEMIRDDLGRETVERLEQEPVTISNPSFDPEKHATPESDVKPYEVVNPGWSIEGVCRVSRDGETTYSTERNGVQYHQIRGAEHLDPVKRQSTARPQLRTQQTSLADD